MGMAVGGKGGIKNEINVTPLVDVVLVLLIIFMVVTPMLQRGKDVHLPKATHTDEDQKSADPIILSVTTDKRMWLENDAYDEANLEEALRTRLNQGPGRKILLKGDEALTFGDVRKVMNVARRAGAKGVALGVEELKEK